MILYNFCNETLYITAAYNSENTIIAIPILSTHWLHQFSEIWKYWNM